MIAKGFLATSKLIDSCIHDGILRLTYYSYPHTVNASASCELFLKSLLILNDGDCQKIHHLDELYDKLDTRLKSAICERYVQENCEMSLEQCLHTYRNAIVEWRYAYGHEDKDQGKCKHKPLTAAWRDLIVLDTILSNIVDEQLQSSRFCGMDNREQEDSTDAN